MPNRSTAHILLSLFTTQQRAAEIEGDLLEESSSRGRTWFAYHVAGVTLALFKESCKEAPIRLTLLTALATGFIILVAVLVDRVFFAPDAMLQAPLAGLIAVVLVTFAGGCALAYLGAKHGIRAAACTAILLTTLIVVKYAFADWNIPVVGYLLLSIAILPVPFMAGSLLGHNLRSRNKQE